MKMSQYRRRETLIINENGIGKIFYNVAYPFSAVVYGLFEVREPNVDRLKSFRR